MHVHAYLRKYVCVCVCVCARVYVYVSMYVCGVCIYIFFTRGLSFIDRLSMLLADFKNPHHEIFKRLIIFFSSRVSLAPYAESKEQDSPQHQTFFLHSPPSPPTLTSYPKASRISGKEINKYVFDASQV